MLNPLKEITRYALMFRGYLGRRVYLIFFFSFLAAVSEGFGILMILPLLESLGGDPSSFEPDSTLNVFLLDFFEYFGLSDSTSSIIILITIAFIFKGLITFCALGFNAYLIGKLLQELKSRLFDEYKKMSYSYYSAKDTGYFTNLINEQPNKALEAFNQLTILGGQIINTFVLMLIAFLMTWMFGLMALVTGIFLLIIFMSLNTFVRKLSRNTASENGNLNKWLIQTLHAFKYLTATAQTHKLETNIIFSINRLAQNQIKSGVAAAFTQAVREPVAVLFIMSVVFIQITIFKESVEPILVSIVLFYRALNSTLAVQSAFQGTFQHIGSMELVNDEFEAQKINEVVDGNIKIKSFYKEIAFENVTFEYKDGNPVLKNITLDIPVKTSVAFVGESGSGKSTLIDLVSLVHLSKEGSIMIDGIPSSGIAKESWRKQIGYVSQDTVIFNDSIANNICMWDGDYNKDNNLFSKIKDAARQANILDFILSLEDGFDSLVGDRGVLLSGGQKQRLFIARELFRMPNLLILDEATSALDSQSEKEIQDSIDLLKGKITIIVIAHRLATIKNVDLIYVLENGNLLEKGSYKELTNNENSRFKRMIELQSL
jgi:ABC-type multidrug transport system fused ATPase/permease subunit